MDINNNQILGTNKEGEICARGIQIMKGYLKNEQATAETLKDGWLHTGRFYQSTERVTMRIDEYVPLCHMKHSSGYRRYWNIRRRGILCDH